MCLGIPGKVVETYREHDVLDGQGRFRRRLKARSAWSTSRTPTVGEYVLVHVGFALSRIDEAEAPRGVRVPRSG